MCLLWRNVCLVLWPIFWLGYLFFWSWAGGVACIFLRLILCCFVCYYFLPIWGLTDFYVYVKCFCVYVNGRKEGRKAGDKPWGLVYTDTNFWIYVGYTDFIAYVKGRKGGDNPCALSISDTDFLGYISAEVLTHPWLSPPPLEFWVCVYISESLCCKWLSLFFQFHPLGRLLFSSFVADFL